MSAEHWGCRYEYQDGVHICITPSGERIPIPWGDQADKGVPMPPYLFCRWVECDGPRPRSGRNMSTNELKKYWWDYPVLKQQGMEPEPEPESEQRRLL